MLKHSIGIVLDLPVSVEKADTGYRATITHPLEGKSTEGDGTTSSAAIDAALEALALKRTPPEGLGKGLALRAKDMGDSANYLTFITRDARELPPNDGWGSVIGVFESLQAILAKPERLHELVTCYQLSRRQDVTGVSGEGVVAYATAIRTPRGEEAGVLVDLLGETKTHTWHKDMDSVRRVHCHDGATVLEPREVDETGRQELAIRAMLVGSCKVDQWGWSTLVVPPQERAG